MYLDALTKILLFLFFSLAFVACEDDEGMGGMDDERVLIEGTAGAPTPYDLNAPSHFPKMYIPPENPLTEEGVLLGRMLFYDPILSADSSMSCASCHRQELAFTDGLSLSPGIDGIAGRRSSMSLFNIGYVERGLFWDGRVGTLEEQALLPVEDPVELHTTWPEVEEKLQRHPDYPLLFKKAFEIEYKDEITKALAARAMAQFERTLISGEAPYDKSFRREEFMDDDAVIGQINVF